MYTKRMVLERGCKMRCGAYMTADGDAVLKRRGKLESCHVDKSRICHNLNHFLDGQRPGDEAQVDVDVS